MEVSYKQQQNRHFTCVFIKFSAWEPKLTIEEETTYTYATGIFHHL